MTTLDDWPRVKEVLAGALACDGDERRLYLNDACGADTALRARVDTLLAAGDRAGRFLETPTGVLLDREAREDLSGSAVDSYRLESRLGEGASGRVYLARDANLDRPVALKLLAPELAADRSRVRRFHQEARAASSLNHPHIVVVHDFGELDGRPYMVTELIEGETLRHRLRQGPLALRDVVDIGVQIAGALGAAHARGLVHRDIKPENVMVRPDGYAKVLDFGLAKLAPGSSSPDAESHTQSGMVLGTPRYMSPEQARGLDLDARSDVWSLGVVLYEMAAGELPFSDDGRVVAGEGAHRELPADFLAIVSKALHSARDRRYPSGAELCADLKQVRERLGPAAPGRRPRLTSRVVTLAAALAVAAGAMASVALMGGRRASPPGDVQKAMAVLPFENVSGDAGIDYLRLALADEVATALSSTPSLAVRPMASSRRFAGGEVSPEAAGRQLRVGGVVTGHFSRHGSELRITVEAIEVDGNRLVWRDTIAAPTTDSIALRDRLTSRLRSGLLPALGAGAPAEVRARPRNAEASTLYLRSLALSTDPAPNRDAISLLERATALDPDDADTWAVLASRYYADGHYDSGGIEELRRSEAAARRAMALDPNHVSAVSQLVALQLEAGGRLQDAHDSAMRLVEQRPDSGEAHYTLSYVLRYGGLLEHSVRECDEAFSRDPTNPVFMTCAAAFMRLGRYDRALDFISLDAGSEAARLVRRLVYMRMGRRSDAREEHRQQSPDYPAGLAPAGFHDFIARCLAGAAPDGHPRLSDDDLRFFETRRHDPEPLYFFGGDLAYCGDTAAAVQLLGHAIRRNYCAVSIETDPVFAAIRRRPEYATLLDLARACRQRFHEHVQAHEQRP
jgi:eukaryotic-like serine/threonine-protein kinase